MKKIFNKRENKGITTMTVVISVIILIILASIGINLSVSENGIIKKSKKIVNGMDYSSQLQANETNRIVTGLEDEGGKYLRTTLLVTPESASKVKEINLKIAVSNKDKVTAKTSNKYQYYVSTSADKLQGGQWLDYKLGTPFTIKNITGKRYVFVKQLTDTYGVVTITKGTTVTIDGVQYQRFGEYGFDNNAPTNTAPQIILASTKTIVIENKQTDDEGQIKTVVYEIKKTTDPDDGWKGQDSGRFENLDENTEYQVRTVATDEAGNTSESVVVTVKTTGIPGPESIKSAQNPAGWTNTDRELTISTTVKGYKLETSKDGKNWIKTENQKTYNYGDKVYARLTDGTNFGEQFVFEELQIDKQAPTDTAPTATSTTRSVTVTCTQKDEGSGEDKIKSASGIDTTKTQYRLVTDTTGKTALKDWQNSNVFEGLTHNTTYYVQTKVTDNAGNTTTSAVTTAKTTIVPSGTTSGVITLTPDHNTWTNTDVVVTATTNQTGYTIQMSTDGKTFTDGTSKTLTSNGTVYARLRDSSNNYGASASISISIIDKVAPTLNISKETYQEGFNNWTLPDGGSIENNILTLTKAGTAMSYYYKTGSERWWITLDGYTNKESTKHDGDVGSAGKGNGGINLGSCYFDNAFKSTVSQNSYSGNGWAPQLPINTWSNGFTWSGYEGYGGKIEYVKIYTRTGNEYSQPTVKYRNFKMHGQLYSNFYLINQTNSDDSSKVKVIKYALGNQTVDYFKTAGTATTDGQIRVTANGTYTVYVQDNAGNDTIKTITIDKIDTTAPTTVAPILSTTTNKITVTSKQADGESGVLRTQYAIKESGGNYGNWQDSNSFEKLKQGTKYVVKTRTTNNAGLSSESEETTVTTGTIPGLTTGSNLTFTPTPSGWTNGNVSVAVSTTVKGYTLQTSTDGKTWGTTNPLTYTANGTAYARLWDGNNASAVATTNITNIDKTAPTVTINPNGGSFNTRDVSVTVTGADAGGSNIKTTQYAWSNSNTTEPTGWTNFTNGTAIKTTLNGGISYLWLNIKDNAGNRCATKVSNAFTINTPPSITANPTNVIVKDGENATFSITATNGYPSGISYQWQKKNSLQKTATSTTSSYSSDAMGNYFIKTASDNWYTGINVDNTSVTPGKRYTWSFEVYSDKAITPRIDFNCTAGGYTGNDAAMDSLSNTTTAIPANTWTKIIATCTIRNDAKNPVIFHSFCPTVSENTKVHYRNSMLYEEGEGGWTNISGATQNSYKLTASVNDHDSLYRCVVSNSKVSMQSQFAVLGVLGKPSINLKLNNASGAQYTSGSWTKENVFHTITTAGQDIAKYQYSHDNQNWTDLPTSWTYSKTKDNTATYVINWAGQWNFYVRGVELSGKTTPVANMFNLKIDKTPPTTTAPTATTKTNSITATNKQTDALSGIASIQYQIKKNGTSTWGSLQSSATFGGLTQNTKYDVRTHAVDKAGNASDSAVTTAKTTTVPSGTTSGVITLTPDHNTWTNTDVKVTARTNQTGYTIQISTDGKTFKDGNKVTLTQNGTVYARLRDASNNYGGAASKSISIIDKIAPTDTAPTATSTTRSVTVTCTQKDEGSGEDKIKSASGIDTTKTQYRLVTDTTGKTALKDWQNSNVFEGLTHNTNYYVQTQVTDKAGNTTISKVTTIKTTAVPNGTVEGVITLTPDHTTWTNTDVIVTASSSKTGFTIQVSTDGKTFKDGNKVTLTTNGTVYARLRDASNNYGGAASKSISIIDKIAPTDTAPTATSTTRSVTVTCTQKDEGSGEDKIKSASGIDTTKTQYRLVTDTTGKTALKDWQNSNVFEGLTHNTNYYVQTQVTDKAGNTTISKVTTIKTTAVPNGTVEGVITLTPDHTTWTNTDVIVTVSSSKTGFTIQVSTDGKTFKDGNKVTLTTNGTVYARLRDASNNYGGAASKTISIIDKTAPTFTATIQNVSSSGYDVIIKDVADVGSGIDRVQVPTWTEANGQDDIQSSWATNTSVSATKQLDGTYKYRVNVIDHNNENGKYNSHVYIYDKVGNQKAIELTATVPAVSITWNSNGGSTVTATSGKAGDAIGILPTTTRTGYTFNGWYTAATGGTQISQDTIVPVNDITYYAQWTIINYKISYTLNGGTVTGNPTSYNVESETVILKNPTKAGYNFTGWTGSNGETAQTTVTIPTGNTENKNYTAHFEKTITLTQMHGGTSKTAQSYTLKDSETQHTFSLGNSNVSYSGWTFKGWTNGATAKAPDYTSTITISDSKTVYATFSRTYTATFIDYNGTSKRAITRSAIAYGNGSAGGVGNQYGSISVPGQGTFNGWTSTGWSTGTAANSGSTTPISTGLNSNPTYYGMYQQTISLAYNSYGRGNAPGTQYGTRYTNSYSINNVLNPTFTVGAGMSYPEYMFLGWCEAGYKDVPMNYYADVNVDVRNENGYDAKKLMIHYLVYGRKERRRIGQHLPGEGITISQNTILYGQWYVQLYRLGYNGNGGTPTLIYQYYYKGQTLSGMPTATKGNGQNFLGWFSPRYKDSPMSYYTDHYPDLHGWSAANAWSHYVNFGRKEGRRISEFQNGDIFGWSQDFDLYAGWY